MANLKRNKKQNKKNTISYEVVRVEAHSEPKMEKKATEPKRDDMEPQPGSNPTFTAGQR